MGIRARQILHHAKKLHLDHFHTQVNYIIDGYGLLYLLRYKQKV